MNISRLVVRNFRNFQLLDVPIRSGVNCILGENNAGKSNLLHALRLALDANLPSTFRQLTENDVHGCAGLNNAQQILISVEFTGYKATPFEAIETYFLPALDELGIEPGKAAILAPS